jgi:hypothetical protein
MKTHIGVELRAGRGIVGDRHFDGTGTVSASENHGQQLTLIEAEVLDALREDGLDLTPVTGAPQQVVDHEGERRLGGEIGGEPVQAVLPGVAGIAGGWTWRRRHGGWARSGEHLRGRRRRSRQPALAGVGLQQWALEEWLHDPERDPRSSSVARAAKTRRPRSDARTRASSSNRDFPIPAARSMTRAPPPVARRRAALREPARARGRARAARPAGQARTSP